jgi:hypothetical protein
MRATRLALTVAAALALACAFLDAAAPPAGKPPWRRWLKDADVRKAVRLLKELDRLQAAGRFDEALKAARTLADLRAKAQGADHWQSINARHEVAAIRLVLKQDALARKEYASIVSLQSQADVLMAKGRYREAQSLLEKILAIRRKVLGEDHSNTASSYNNLATNQDAQGKHALAEVGHRKALAIRLEVLGEDHPDTAESYNNLAANQDAQGKHIQAEEGYRKALAIYRKVLGEDHPLTATSYNNLTHSQHAQGKYAPAEVGLRRALAIYRKVLGEDHPDTATSYDNLATNQDAQGKHALAEEGHRKALAIRRKLLGEDHPLTATSYNNLALNQNARGKYDEAEEGYCKALAINRKLLGEDHPRMATSYNNLAFNHNAQGKYALAEVGFRRALAIRRKLLGEDHPQTAQSYNNLAASQDAQGRYVLAEEGHRKALAIYRKLLGEEHPDTALSYKNLAANQNAQGKYDDAEDNWRKSADRFDKARGRFASSGLERATRTGEFSPLPQLAAVLARNGKPAAAWQRFEQSLGRGTWDDLSARLRRPPEERTKQAELVARLGRLDRLVERAFSVKSPTDELLKQRKELLSQQRQAQEELSEFMAGLEKRYGPVGGQVFDRAAIQAALPSDTALVGWIDLAGQAKAKDPNGEHWAVLLRSAGEPAFVRLPRTGAQGEWSATDDHLPAHLRAALQSDRGDWRPLAKRLRKQRLTPLEKHLEATDNLPAVRRLVVLPSPALAGLPVEVLVEGYTVSYALSGTLFAHLRKQPAPKSKGLLALGDPVFDLLAGDAKEPPLPPGGLLLTAVTPRSNAARSGLRPNDVLLRYAGKTLSKPDDLGAAVASTNKERILVRVWRDGEELNRRVQPGPLGVVLASEPAPKALAEQRRIDRRLASRGGEEDKWAQLPGTRAEVEALARLFGDEPGPLLLFDSAASEQRLYKLAKRRELGRYRYVHLATHGEVDDRLPLRSAVILSRDDLPDAGKQLDAGLPIFDGRLTAQEVLEDWRLDSELVTLSACQTALGKYERGEGFIGFAQALILCGSRAVCLSLWKVDDSATALLMERFYQNLLGKREGLKAPLPKAEALAEAKDWLRSLTRQQAVQRLAGLTKGVARGKGRKMQPLLPSPPAAAGAKEEDRPYAHPYYWAAFVLIGDER